MICLHILLPSVFFFLGFQFSQELVEVLLVLDDLFFRRFGVSQTHNRADGKTKDRADIGAGMFRFHALAALFGIFAVIFDQPTQCCKAMQTSTDRATELTAVQMTIFLTLLSSRSMNCRISPLLSESILDRSEENCSLTLPSCCSVRRMELVCSSSSAWIVRS